MTVGQELTLTVGTGQCYCNMVQAILLPVKQVILVSDGLWLQ